MKMQKVACQRISPNTSETEEIVSLQSTEVIDLTEPVTFSSLLVDLTHLPAEPVDVKRRRRSTTVESLTTLLDTDVVSQIDHLSDYVEGKTVEADSNVGFIDLTEEFSEPPIEQLPDTMLPIFIDHCSCDNEREGRETSNEMEKNVIMNRRRITSLESLESLSTLLYTDVMSATDCSFDNSEVETDETDLSSWATDSVSTTDSVSLEPLPNTIHPTDHCYGGVDQVDIEGQFNLAEEVYLSTNDTVMRLEDQLSLLYDKIFCLENAEVDDLDSDNSNFILLGQYKAKACEIYAEINQLVGKAVEVPVTPITLDDATQFTEFNKRLEEMVNNAELPCTFDVLECLKLCNRQYGYQLSDDDCYTIVEDVFDKLQFQRRKQRSFDLNEMFSYYAKGMVDPAVNDLELQAKLDRNKSKRSTLHSGM